MLSAVALLVLLSSLRISAFMSTKPSLPAAAAAAGIHADAGATMEAVQGLSRLSSSYDAFLIGGFCAGY